MKSGCSHLPLGKPDVLSAGYCQTWPDGEIPFDEFKFKAPVKAHQNCQLFAFQYRGCFGDPVAIVERLTEKHDDKKCYTVLQDHSVRSMMMQCDANDAPGEKKTEGLRIETAGHPLPANTVTNGAARHLAAGFAVPTTTEVLAYELGNNHSLTSFTTVHLAPTRSFSVPFPESMIPSTTHSAANSTSSAAEPEETQGVDHVLTEDARCNSRWLSTDSQILLSLMMRQTRSIIEIDRRKRKAVPSSLRRYRTVCIVRSMPYKQQRPGLQLKQQERKYPTSAGVIALPRYTRNPGARHIQVPDSSISNMQRNKRSHRSC
nr:hypothetical protein CFP56_54916 [Quercus suber]